ncbi:MAG: hypothetical protein U9R15_07450 [Chloroflexota bacterium]|nr:hypothetical protein [Chloroflexota bacterium]
MGRLTFTQDNLPTSEEFERMLARTITQSNPVDDMLEIADELGEYEREYGMTSAEFYEQFNRGVLDDELQHCIGWAGAFEIFTKLKRVVEAALMREAAWREVQVEPARVAA